MSDQLLWAVKNGETDRVKQMISQVFAFRLLYENHMTHLPV